MSNDIAPRGLSSGRLGIPQRPTPAPHKPKERRLQPKRDELQEQIDFIRWVTSE